MLQKLLIITAFFLLFLLPGVAQDDSEWSVWLSSEGKLYRIYSDGDVEEIIIQLPDNHMIDGFIKPSNDGRLLAFCTLFNEQYHAIVYDVARRHLLRDFPLDTAQNGCSVRFNDTGTMLLSILNRELSDDRQTAKWDIYVIDVPTFTLVARLSSENDLFVNQVYYGFPVPIVFQDDYLAFRVELLGEAITHPGYIWHFTRNQLEDAPRYGWFNYDELSVTDESIWLAEYPELPMLDAGDACCGPIFNVIIGADTNGNEVTLFNHPSSILTSTRFIDSGRKVAVSFYGAEGWDWFWFDREGNQGTISSDFMPNSYAESIVATPDGFIFPTISDNGSGEIISYQFEGNNLTTETFWIGADEDGYRPVILGVTPLEDVPGLRPLTDLEMITFEAS